MQGDRGEGGTARTTGLVVVAVVALVVIAYGGYGRHWSWVGVNGHTATLWDWLHLLLLPITAVALPLWLRHRPRLGPAGRGGLLLAGAGFLVIVAAGYLIPWAWTGFAGNRLWDWLNLGALPLAIALVPVILELRDGWGPRHTIAAATGAVVFLVLVLGGYLAPWRWTGFTGNTVWDWLHLLLLPLLVPLAIVPALAPVLRARMQAASTAGPTAGGEGDGDAGSAAAPRQEKITG